MEDRLLKFILALRASGVRISLAESADAFEAVRQMGVKDKETFRLSLQATLVKDRNNLVIFNDLFPHFFGGQPVPPMMNLDEELTPEQAEQLSEALRQFSARLREMMERLLDGQELTPEELEELARRVGLPNISDMRYQDWMARRMQQALQFAEVREAMQELMELLAELGMDPEMIEQLGQMMAQNQEVLREQLRQYAGQQIAEQISETDPQEEIDGLFNRPFKALSDSDMQKLRKEVRRIANALRTRVALRQKRAKSGQLDAKATIRANLKHNNVPITIKHRDRKLKPKLVVICDISTSMRHVSELMLSLIYAMQDQVSKTHAFAFIDHLEYISPDFERYESEHAVAQVLERMPSGYYNTNLGHSLRNFSQDYMDTVDSKATFILVGDGRNNYNNPQLEIFRSIARRSNRSIWINPEPRSMWGTGDSDMLEYAPLCDQVWAVSNLTELTRAVDLLLGG